MPIVKLPEDKKKEGNRTNSYLTGLIAGTISVFIRHPLDTAASRIKASPTFSYREWQNIVFPHKMHKFSSLYKGIGSAYINRFTQLISMELQSPFEQFMNNKLMETLKDTDEKTALTITRSFTSISFGSFTALLACIPNQYKISRQLGTQVINPAYALPPTICRNTVWFLAHSMSEQPVHFALNTLKIAEKNRNVQQNLESFSTAMIASVLSVPFDRCKILIQSGQLPPGTLNALTHIIKRRAPFQGAGIECMLQAIGVGLFYTTKAILQAKDSDKDALVVQNRTARKP